MVNISWFLGGPNLDCSWVWGAHGIFSCKRCFLFLNDDFHPMGSNFRKPKTLRISTNRFKVEAENFSKGNTGARQGMITSKYC